MRFSLLLLPAVQWFFFRRRYGFRYGFYRFFHLHHRFSGRLWLNNRGRFGTGGGADISATGATGAATFTASAGAAGPIGAPQDSQNFTPGASAAPHFGQEGRASIFAPQDSQNLITGRDRASAFLAGLGIFSHGYTLTGLA